MRVLHDPDGVEETLEDEADGTFGGAERAQAAAEAMLLRRSNAVGTSSAPVGAVRESVTCPRVPRRSDPRRSTRGSSPAPGWAKTATCTLTWGETRGIRRPLVRCLGVISATGCCVLREAGEERGQMSPRCGFEIWWVGRGACAPRLRLAPLRGSEWRGVSKGRTRWLSRPSACGGIAWKCSGGAARPPAIAGHALGVGRSEILIARLFRCGAKFAEYVAI